MFAYCGNNPVIYTDDSGNIRSHVMVSFFDGGALGSSYSSSIGTVLIIRSEGIDENTKNIYAEAFSDCIIVYDSRYCKEGCSQCNPSMQIYNSYKISDKAQQKDILEILVEHDKQHSTQHIWGRTVDSMLIEWDAHNDLYGLSKRERVAHTDFDKNSENWKKADYYQFAWEEMWNEIVG